MFVLIADGILAVDPVSLLSSLDPFAAAVLGGVGLLVVADGLRSLRDYWRFRHPATPVYSIVPGTEPVEVDGVATPRSDEDLVRSPFTDTPCLICAYTVEAYYSTTPQTDDRLFDPRDFVRPSGWTEVHSGIRAVSFYVDDGTGKILVDPDGAALRLSTHETTISDGDEPPKPIREFARGVADTDDADWADRLLASGRRDHLGRVASLFEWEIEEWSFIERRLEPGSPVNVSGVASARRTDRDEIGVVQAIVSRSNGGGSDEPLVQTNRSTGGLVISDVTGAELEKTLLRWGFLKGVTGIGLVATGALALFFEFVA